MPSEPELNLQFYPSGRNSTGMLVAQLGDLTYVDNGNISKALFRQRFARTLSEKWPGIPLQQLQEQLDLKPA